MQNQMPGQQGNGQFQAPPPPPSQNAWQHAHPPQQDPVYQPMPYQVQGRSGGTDTAKIIVIIIAVLGCLYLAACLAVALFLGSVVTVGLASCDAQLADAPAQDSPEDAAFITDTAANDRDLATFDALSGAIGSLHDDLADDDGDETPKLHRVLTVEQLRNCIEGGSWPSDPAGYGDTQSARSPQLWVRLAELSQAHLEEQTGETWEVLDFAYPFPDNGPIPWPAFITEGSSTRTLLRCTSGSDEGLCVVVNCYRWADPVYYEFDLDAARESRDGSQASRAALAESGILSDRDWVYDNGDVVVWCTGDDDPLRDPEAYTEFAAQVQEQLGNSCRVTLVPADAPASVIWSVLSYDYPNHRPATPVTIEEAQRALDDSVGWMHLDGTWSESLLTTWISPDSESEQHLDGSLAPEPEPVAIEDAAGGHAPKGADKL